MIRKLLKFFLLLAIVFIYACYIEPAQLKTNEIPLKEEQLPESYNGLKIVHFSDLHYGRGIDKTYLNKLVAEINLINPDIVIFSGDLIDKDRNPSEENITILKKSLANIKTKYGKYTIFGNHDIKKRDLETQIYAYSDFILLENSYNIIYNKNNDKIFIGGLDTASYNKDDIDMTMEYFKTNPDIYKILILHEPDIIDNITNKYNINLALAGHSHGGQVRLPIIGKLYTPYLSQKYYDNYYKVNNTKLYISSGIGTSRINIRLFNTPSLNFYRLN